MIDLLRPILELCIVIPGLLLAYFPVKSYLKRPLAKISIWLLPLILSLCICLGLFCWYFHSSTLPALALIALITIILYLKTLRISLWKSGTIALSVCAVFACINSLSRALNAVILLHAQSIQADPWFDLRTCFFITQFAGLRQPLPIIRLLMQYEQWLRTTILLRRGMYSGFCRLCSSRLICL